MAIKKLIAGKHSCVGHLTAGDSSADTSDKFFDRPAMLVYVGKFDSMDGEVEVTEEHIDLLIENHNANLAKLTGLSDEQLVRMVPPLQLDHSVSASVTVGRVMGKFYKGKHTNKSGEEVPALFCERVRTLGKENVEKVKDGRWVNISIGAALDEGKFNELSITPFPAADNAALLGARMAGKVVWSDNYKGRPCTIVEENGKFVPSVGGTQIKKNVYYSVSEAKSAIKDYIAENLSRFSEGEEKPMNEKLKKHLMEKCKMSEEQADEHMKKMKSHMGKKLAEDEAKVDEHMSKLTDEELSKLADDVTEEDKKLAGDGDGDADDKEGAKKLAAAKPKLIALSKGFVKTANTVALAAKKGMISARLGKLQALAKITPAERKKIDIAKLAGDADTVIDRILKTYEDREPVIDARVHGTTRAVNLAKLQKDAKTAALTAETKKDFGVKLSAEEEKALADGGTVAPPINPTANGGSGHEEHMAHLAYLLGDHPAKDAVLAHVAKMMEPEKLASEETEANAESHEKQMSALAADIKRMQNEHQEFTALVGEVLGVKPAELM